MESELLFRRFKEHLPEMRTENEFYRWAERYMEQTRSPSLEGKKLVLRLHQESSNLSYIDDAQEDMIFMSLYKAYRRYEHNERPEKSGKRDCREVSEAELQEMTCSIRELSEILYGSHDCERSCESSRVAVDMTATENVPPTANRCHEISSECKRLKQNSLKIKEHRGSRMMRIQLNIPLRYKGIFSIQAPKKER